nr:hypothetical protein [Streptomyces noursei]
MRVGTRVDRAADLGNPERHPVMLEEREDQAELIPIEHALRFTDDDCIKTAVRILQLTQQRGGSRSALPRQGASLTDVEILVCDHPVHR